MLFHVESSIVTYDEFKSSLWVLQFAKVHKNFVKRPPKCKIIKFMHKLKNP
jgi:hypothetical protein